MYIVEKFSGQVNSRLSTMDTRAFAAYIVRNPEILEAYETWTRRLDVGREHLRLMTRNLDAAEEEFTVWYHALRQNFLGNHQEAPHQAPDHWEPLPPPAGVRPNNDPPMQLSPVRSGNARSRERRTRLMKKHYQRKFPAKKFSPK